MSGDPLVLLSGAGQHEDAWDAVVAALPAGIRTIRVPLGATDAEPFTLDGAARRVVRELDRRGLGSAHVCGLSLGAMVALRLALDAPARVTSLVLAAGQVRPPRTLMRIQDLVVRVLPERAVAANGVGKAELRGLLAAAATADFRDDLATVRAPTLVLCGSRDRANLRAARALASGIPKATLRILEGAGHEANLDRPEAFAAAMTERVLPDTAGDRET